MGITAIDRLQHPAQAGVLHSLQQLVVLVALLLGGAGIVHLRAEERAGASGERQRTARRQQAAVPARLDGSAVILPGSARLLEVAGGSTAVTLLGRALRHSCQPRTGELGTAMRVLSVFMCV